MSGLGPGRQIQASAACAPNDHFLKHSKYISGLGPSQIRAKAARNRKSIPHDYFSKHSEHNSGTPMKVLQLH